MGSIAWQEQRVLDRNESPSPRRRGMAIVAFAVLASCSSSETRGSAPFSPDKPHWLGVLPDGRKLQFRCSGRGTPTVLLESGFGADSGAWYKVQPDLARQTRVCAYDRAGYGLSDPGPLPRDGAAIARDLDQGLRAARINGPFIVVGHSAGGLYGRLFTARRTADVKGLILLDPTVERRAPQPEGDGLDGIRRRLQRCAGAAEASPQPALDDPKWVGCLPPKASDQAIMVARRPATWRGQLSELDSIFGRTSEQVSRIGPVLRDIPIYVITASDTAAGGPFLPFSPRVSIWEAQHQQLAGQSRYGFQTTVLSTHLVMIARPDVVISAAKAMLASSRAGRAPDPLPASETEPAAGFGGQNPSGTTLSPFGTTLALPE